MLWREKRRLQREMLNEIHDLRTTNWQLALRELDLKAKIRAMEGEQHRQDLVISTLADENEMLCQVVELAGAEVLS